MVGGHCPALYCSPASADAATPGRAAGTLQPIPFHSPNQPTTRPPHHRHSTPPTLHLNTRPLVLRTNAHGHPPTLTKTGAAPAPEHAPLVLPAGDKVLPDGFGAPAGQVWVAALVKLEVEAGAAGQGGGRAF
jgi:hypothetical protein